MFLEEEPELGLEMQPCLSTPRGGSQRSRGWLGVGLGGFLWGAEGGVRLRGGLCGSPGCGAGGGGREMKEEEDVAPSSGVLDRGRSPSLRGETWFCSGSSGLRGVPCPCSGEQLKRRQGPHTFDKDT